MANKEIGLTAYEAYHAKLSEVTPWNMVSKNKRKRWAATESACLEKAARIAKREPHGDSSLIAAAIRAAKGGIDE